MRSLPIGLGLVVLVSMGLGAEGITVGAAAAELPFVPVVRLADVSARAGGWREPDTVIIGDTSRYVLGQTDVVSIHARAVGSDAEVDAKGRLDIEVRCSAASAGFPNLVVELLGAGVAGAERIGERVTRRMGGVCGDRRDEWVPVRLDGLRPTARFLVVTASIVERPPPVVTAPSVEVPPGAELRVSLGLRAVGTPPDRPIDAHVTAVAPDGRRHALARRRVRPSAVVPPGEWVEWRFPLDDARRVLGPQMGFEFEAASHSESSGLLHVLWGDPAVWAPSPATPAAPSRNLVLVSLDTLRADRLAVMGYPLDITPNLDRLAHDGTMFTDVVASANWTKPSHATMLTGTFPCVHGVDWGGPAMGGPLPAGIVPIAERLRAAGAVTAAFTEDAYVSPDVFQRGFDVFVANHGNTGAFADIERTVAAATAWITENARRRFFVFVHTYQVHEPYLPPPAYASLVKTTPVPAFPKRPPPAETSMAHAAAYLGEVAYADAMVGRLLQSIADLGLAKDTVVVVTSDHGEAFGEHGLRFHGQGLHQEQMHVPLIVRAPGLVAAGRRIPDLVGLVDLTPTLLDLLGFERSPWMQGLSLAAAMREGGTQRVPLGRAFPLRGFGKIHGIRGATWKVVFGRRSKIWDLGVDPGEMRPKIAGTRTVEMMQKASDSWCDRGRTLVAQAEDQDRKTRSPPVSIEEQEKLRALGYVE